MKTINPYKVGDKVRLLVDVRDAYQELWHNKGDIEKVVRIAEDGEGLMFDSDLGVHFSKVEPFKKTKKDKQKRDLEFTWGWCGLCKSVFVWCPKCGNNCCNAAFGTINGEPCDVCNLAYQYQDLARKTKTEPSKWNVITGETHRKKFGLTKWKVGGTFTT